MEWTASVTRPGGVQSRHAVRQAFRQGLRQAFRQAKNVLFSNGGEAVGLKTLAASVGEEQRTIEEVYEPHLIREGLIHRTARGRCATRKAAELYGDPSGQPSFV